MSSAQSAFGVIEQPMYISQLMYCALSIQDNGEQIRRALRIGWSKATAVVAALLFGMLAISAPGKSVGKSDLGEVANINPAEESPHIVFLINEDPYNYEAHETVPPFAEMLRREHQFQVTVLRGEGDLPALRFPGLDVINQADLLVIFFRRAALPEEQLEMIRDYLREGRPLVGIRTANHAFSVRDTVREEIPEGYEAWWEFVPEVLGCRNRGYGPSELGTEVAVVPEASDHFILDGFEPTEWHSPGVLYHVAPLLDEEATVLLTGRINDTVEPIAWTRTAGDSRVFYTSLGYPDDFDRPAFHSLIVNGIRWALDRDAE